MIKPVYALVGCDTLLQLQKLGELAAQMPGAQRADFDGETAELADVLDELRSFAMFGSNKLVIVRDADEFVSKYREPLEEYLESPSDSGTLVLRLSSLPGNQRIHKIISKRGEIFSCQAPKDLVKWTTERARSEHKLKLTPDLARLLIELIGDDLGRLDNDLAKLALQCDRGEVDREKVLSSVAFQREREMWDMTNALTAGNTTEALRRWRQLVQLDPSAEFRAVTWLSLWLGDIAAILADDRAAIGKMKWKYKDDLGTLIKIAQKWGTSGYAKALDSLAEVDRQSKSGVGDAVGNVERFILSIATR